MTALLKRRFASALLLGALALIPAGCSKEEALPPNVIATVAARQVTTSDFNRYLERNPGVELAQISPEAASALLDQYLEQILLSEFAATRGIEISTERIAEAVRNDPGSTMVEKQDQLRAQRLESDVAATLDPPTDAQIRRYYDENPAEFEIEESLHIRHILVHDRETAREIEERLLAGEAFEDLSVEHSASPNASRGGDIGFVGRGELPKIFEETIFGLDEGAYSKVIETGMSFHIFKVDEKLAAGTLPFERAAPLIVERLSDETRARALANLTRDARGAVAVVVLPKRLTFEYTGTYPVPVNE